MAKLTQTELYKYGWAKLPSFLYSTDMVLFDDNLSFALQLFLEGQKFAQKIE